jgi:hypothetical protein
VTTPPGELGPGRFAPGLVLVIAAGRHRRMGGLVAQRGATLIPTVPPNARRGLIMKEPQVCDLGLRGGRYKI